MADLIQNLISPTKLEGHRFDPLTLIPTLGSTLLGGLLNTGGNEYLSSKNVGRSKELMDYQMNLQKNYQAWLLNNQYPMQLQAMRNAGMNPAFANGQNLGTLSASQPNASAGLSQAHLFQMQDALLGSQIKKTEQETKNLEQERRESQARQGKIYAETDLLDKDNLMKLDYMKASLDNLIASTHRYDADANKLVKETEKLDVEMDNLKANIDLTLSSIAENLANAKLTSKQIAWFDSQMNATINQLLSNAALNFGENSRRAKKMMHEIFNIDALTGYYDSQNNLNNALTDMQNFALEQEKRFNTGKQVVGMLSQGFGAAAQAISSIKGFSFAPYSVQNGQLNPYTPSPITGFR